MTENPQNRELKIINVINLFPTGITSVDLQGFRKNNSLPCYLVQ